MMAHLHIVIVVFEDSSLKDSYICGHAKDVAYQTAPTRDVMDRRSCRAVAQQTLQGVIQNFKRRLTLCLKNEGGHFKHLLFRMIKNNG